MVAEVAAARFAYVGSTGEVVAATFVAYAESVAQVVAVRFVYEESAGHVVPMSPGSVPWLHADEGKEEVCALCVPKARDRIDMDPGPMIRSVVREADSL